MVAFRSMRRTALLPWRALAASAVLLLGACGEDCYDPKHPPASIQSAYGHEGCPCDQTTPVCVQGALEQFALVCVGERWSATATDTCHP